MDEVIKKIIEFRDERNWGQFHTPENLIKSINIEAGELLECVQWTNDLNINNVKDELADVMNYCLLLCDKLNLNPEEIILDKEPQTTWGQRFMAGVYRWLPIRGQL